MSSRHVAGSWPSRHPRTKKKHKITTNVLHDVFGVSNRSMHAARCAAAGHVFPAESSLRRGWSDLAGNSVASCSMPQRLYARRTSSCCRGPSAERCITRGHGGMLSDRRSTVSSSRRKLLRRGEKTDNRNLTNKRRNTRRETQKIEAPSKRKKTSLEVFLVRKCRLDRPTSGTVWETFTFGCYSTPPPVPSRRSDREWAEP